MWKLHIDGRWLEEDLKHSGAPPPYMSMKFKKQIRKIKKKMEFWDIKSGCPIYSHVKFREKKYQETYSQ